MASEAPQKRALLSPFLSIVSTGGFVFQGPCFEWREGKGIFQC